MKKIHYIVGLVLSVMPQIMSAHVYYIATDEDVEKHGGSNFIDFIAPALELKYIAMMIATIVGALLVYWFLNRNKIIHKWTEHMATIGESYKAFIPLIVRLSLGVILISGAIEGFLISPVLETSSELIILAQLVVGFFLIAGFMTGLSAFAALILFIMAISQNVYLIGSFDILALIASLFILDSRRPGADHILGIPDYAHVKAARKYLPTVLRMGIGIGMAYLAIVEKILNPNLAAFVAETTGLVDVIPVSSAMWAFSAGLIELAVGLALVFGFKTRLTSVIALLVLSMSFFYFGESVTSHVTLFGTLAGVFILGVGPFGIDSIHPKDKHLE